MAAKEPVLPPELAGRFAVERLLGKGSMGVVLLARDRALDRPVAIKLASTRSSECFELRFLREARTLAGLTHERIPRIFSYGVTESGPWLVQEFVDGRSLADGARPIDPMRAMRALADALAAVHAAGLVHRDVKPANIVLDATSSSMARHLSGSPRSWRRRRASRSLTRP